MIFQIHWQNQFDKFQTAFVCQGCTEELFARGVDPMDWAKQQICLHISTMPCGWLPLICWGDHPAMVLAPGAIPDAY